ncbi:hypothetical protein KBF38_22675 [bacterium]|nr:hypothetical protein [bacterium]
MRVKVKGKLTVRAISGTHVVFLAFSMCKADIKGLMGFAIQRIDNTADETIWLRGNKTFASIRQSTGIEDASSHEHPFQGFQWADYSAKPGYSYEYRVIAMYGRPGALKNGAETSVNIDTEPLAGNKHEIYFNRGAIASQAFSKRFPGLSFEEAGEPAKDWLTRDLLPGLLDFVGKAKDSSYSIRAAIFEFKLPEALRAFKEAKAKGADVKIIYHALDDSTGRANEDAIDTAKIRSICVGRTNTKLMHNKFIVLLKNNKPVAVWTGSTNFSTNALYGQLNVGHVLHDTQTARAFLNYWDALEDDPSLNDLKSWNESNNPIPDDDLAELTPMFSPHKGREVYDWWVQLASEKSLPLFMTFPFGMPKEFRQAYDSDDGVLRFALLDKYVNGGTAESRAAATEDTIRIRKYQNVGMALGERIFVKWIDGWLPEGNPLGVNVNWVHTKFMLIDPLGQSPTTLTGSANFSLPSVNSNEENLIIIRGDTRVADIYFGEFMRLFAHHRFRESVARHIKEFGSTAFNTWKPQDLFEDYKKWAPRHFVTGTEYDIKRRYFADE